MFLSIYYNNSNKSRKGEHNTEIKTKLKEAGVFQYELAEAMGVSEFTLVKRLRKEQSAEEKERINTIIDILAYQKRGDQYE